MKLNSFVALFLLLIVSTAKGQYYSTAFGQNGAQLKTSLHNIIKNHNGQTWPLWSFFNTTDNRNGLVWDIYSDIPGGTPPYQFTMFTNQCGTYSSENECYNHEHTWPSTFFNDNTPMRTDLFHVMPTDGYVNNKRSNYPYGKVNTSNWTSQNGSKLGNSSTYPGYSDKVFEPIDSFKGDVARNYFYMSTRYENEDGGWKNWEMANGANLTSDAITLLLAWHHLDPVSQKEIDRNNAVYAIQGNRNPFIDYPIFADCIWGMSDCAGVGLSEKDLQLAIEIYPNPSNDILNINANHTTPIRVSIINIFGQKEIDQDFTANQINISNLIPGNYCIILQTKEGPIKKLFVKK